MQIKIGCDPEIFVKKDGVLVSAYGLIEGDKQNPLKVPRGAVQVDGMALEFNTDPASSEDEFVMNIEQVMAVLKSMCPEHEFYIEPVAHFGQEYIKAQPDAAKELGCDPDFNAWTDSANPRPDGNSGIRTASGHVHIGWGENYASSDKYHRTDCCEVGKQMDFFLGLPSLFYDTDTERRSLYGKGGAIRFKPYGVEYRTLSNKWLNNKDRMRWVFRQAQEGMKRMLSGEALWQRFGDVQEIINTSNKDEAFKIIRAANIQMG